MAKICHICRKKFEGEYANDKKYCKVRDHCHYTHRVAAHNIYNLKYSTSEKIYVVFPIDQRMIITFP